jgi:hypothetical protein
LTQNRFSTSCTTLCGWMGKPCSRAALRMRASDASTQAAMTGCSTSVSVEMTWASLDRFSGGRAFSAFQTNWSTALESLPPLQPTTQGIASTR